MIKIITAIGNPNLNNVLKKYNEFNIIGNDILYSDGIIELLEKDEEINYLILGESFEDNIELLIDKIKEINNKIKIIIIINKNNNFEKNKLFKYGVFDFFYEDEEIENIINFFKTKNIEYLNNELRNEIDNLKKIIIENNKKTYTQKINKKLIIGITGTDGIGKTTACILFSNALNKNNKILIIDYDFNNPQLEFIYNKKIDYSKTDENNINDFIFNVDKNIDILIGLNILNSYNKINFNSLKNQILKLKNNYDYIFVDTSLNNKYEYNKYIFDIFDYIFLLSGSNNIEKLKYEKNIKNITEKININKDKIRLTYYKLNLLEIFKLIINKNNCFNIKIIGIIKNYIFIKNNITKENKIINKIIIKKIMKKL